MYADVSSILLANKNNTKVLETKERKSLNKYDKIGINKRERNKTKMSCCAPRQQPKKYNTLFSSFLVCFADNFYIICDVIIFIVIKRQ